MNPNLFKAVLCLIMLLGITFIGVKVNKAQEPAKDVPPYEFATTDGDVHVYKAVYQGCELFIVRGHAGSLERADSVAITTGRGCK